MNKDEFVKKYNDISKRALAFNAKARKEGLLSLDDEIDRKKTDDRDIFEYGMRFVVDGYDFEIIDGILSNIIDQEKDESIKLLKEIQREAVMSIQSGENPRVLLHKLNSFTDIPLKDDEVLRKYLEE